MRKPLLFSVVLSLFLLIPASITRAQNVSVSGNVYEKNTVKNSFKTPHGTITAILPDDMAGGDAIRGTVLYEPEGSNERKKRNNLEQLIKYRFFLEDGTPVRATVNDDHAFDLITEGARYNLSFTVIPFDQPATPSSFHLILKDAGNNVVGESRPPLMDKSFLMSPIFIEWGEIKSDAVNSVITPAIQTDKKIYLSGENAAISLPLVFGVINMENTIVECWYSFKGGQGSEPVKIDLSTLVGSPRKTVVQLPLNVYGSGEIILEDKNKKVIASQKVHVLKLEASCPKTSLMKNEETVLNVNVKGVKDCPADYLRLKLDNVIGSSVQLGQSNHEEIVIETVNLKYSEIKWDYKAQDEKEKTAKPDKGWENYKANQFSLQRSVTALQTGGFTINIGLSYPPSVYNDPFRQQLDVLKTPEQFNNWQNALMNDMVRFYSDINHDQGLGDLFSEGIRQKIKAAEKGFKPITSLSELDEAKSRVNNFVSWPRIGQEVIVDFLDCTLEAGKAAVENAIANVGNAPVNIEVIESALKYAEHQAAIAENNTLKDAAANFLNEDLWKLQREMNNVSQQFQMLSNIQKLFYDASKAAVNNMRASSGKPHPVNDLIGLLDPFNNLLYTVPGYQQIVLSLIKAEPLSNGQYFIRSVDAKANPANFVFSIAPGTHTEIYEMSTNVIARVEAFLNAADSIMYLQDTQDPPKKDMVLYESYKTATLIIEFYKNAECKKIREGKNIECQSCYGTESCYYRYFGYDHYDCVGGSGYCVRRPVVIGSYKIYTDSKCAGRSTRTRKYAWGCNEGEK